MRVARWDLPSGLAATAARTPLGPLILVDRRLSANEARAAVVIAMTEMRGKLAVLIAYADVWEAARAAEGIDG